MTALLTPEVAVIGASLGGVLAAWRAAQAGAQVLLVAQHAWLGGQMTAQAVPPDEHRLIEHGGASSSYRAFREDIRRLVRSQPGFLDRSTQTAGTNPGDGWVSRLCFEPVHAARWFEALLAPLQSSGQLRLLRGAWAVEVRRQGPRIQQVLLHGADGRSHTVLAQVFIDATDTGDLLKLADLPYRLGKEAQAEFKEIDAPNVANRLDQQPITHVMALRRCNGPGTPVAAPASYAMWRAHTVPQHRHKQFSEHLPGATPGSTSSLPFEAADNTLDWWCYRRIVSRAQWAPAQAAQHLDVSLINWAQNDYALHPLLDGPLPQAEVEAAARELSLCWLHWLQTEAPHGDGGCGFLHWQLATDMLGSADGLAQQIYVRESRRMHAHSTLTQLELTQPPTHHPHSLGIGFYNLDIHPTCVSGHGVNAPVMPFELPLGCFIPQHADNLLPACKNFGTTHLANACTRVHPVEWLVGEVAGLMAAQLVAQKLSARHLPEQPAQISALQMSLRAAGVPLHWPADLLARLDLST